MARVFTNLISSAGVYSIDYIVGGIYDDGLNLAVWTQERAVFRIQTLGSLAKMEIAVTAGDGLADAITVNISVSFDSSSVQYVDITDVLRSVFDRTLRTTMADTCTVGLIMFEPYDSGGNIIPSEIYEKKLKYYDAVVEAIGANNCGALSSYHLLPDTFRLPSYSLCGTLMPQGCTRMTKGGLYAEVLDANGNQLAAVTEIGNPSQATYGWGFNMSGGPAVVNVGNGSIGYIERARVVPQGCCDGWVLLTWWSPYMGGWKSCMAEIMGDADEVSDSERYIKGFDYAESKGGMFGIKARIPNCTPRDYEYYRDIYYSGTIFMYDEALFKGGSNAQELQREMMLKGTPPAVKLVGDVDLDFTLLTEEVSSIW